MRCHAERLAASKWNPLLSRWVPTAQPFAVLPESRPHGHGPRSRQPQPESRALSQRREKYRIKSGPVGEGCQTVSAPLRFFWSWLTGRGNDHCCWKRLASALRCYLRGALVDEGIRLAGQDPRQFDEIGLITRRDQDMSRPHRNA